MVGKRLDPRLRKPMKCNFTSPNRAAGRCRQCGDTAEPGAKQLCIDCSIESGMKPDTSDSKPTEDNKKS
jgi:hypothetical protein